MGEQLHGFAPQKKPTQSSPTVGSHDDQIAAGLLRGVEDALRRILALACTVAHATSLLRANSTTLARTRLAVSAVAFSYSSTGNPTAASPATSILQGSLTVTAVTLQFSCLARVTPTVTALAASSDPSVAIKMCLYISLLPGFGAYLEAALNRWGGASTALRLIIAPLKSLPRLIICP